MNVHKYLERIKYFGKITVSKEVLFALQRQHLLNIPFENLDIHYNTFIKLSINSIYEKIVFNNRGGFCYELNALFNELLVEFGFNSKLISGRVYLKNKNYGKEFDHMAILININNEEYLVDVGFGKFVLEPIKMVLKLKQTDSYGIFVLDKYSYEYYRINILRNNKLIPQYIFKTEEKKLNNFEAMCNFHQSSAESHFTKKKVISIANLNGRTTLNNNCLIITKRQVVKKISFKEDEFDFYLLKYFGIEIKKKTVLDTSDNINNKGN
jgi:N-hydroxyarylamine O-acetyltransferase